MVGTEDTVVGKVATVGSAGALVAEVLEAEVTGKEEAEGQAV